MRYTVVFSKNMFWVYDTWKGEKLYFYSNWDDANKDADKRNGN